MKLALFAVILLFFNLAFGQEYKLNFQEFGQGIDNLTQEYGIPGAAIAIVSKDHIYFTKYIGTQDLNNYKSVDNHTLFQIASISKSFIGLVLSKLVDEKLIGWHDKIIKYLPEFKLANHEATNNLTIFDIVNMQTGLPFYAGRQYLAEAKNRTDIIKSFSNIDLESAIGVRFSYQYALFAVLEEIIYRRTDKEWYTILTEYALNPLGMNNTYAGIEKVMKRGISANLAAPHDDNNEVLEHERFKLNSAAGMVSNLDDLIKWLQLFLGKKNNLLDMRAIKNREQPFLNLDIEKNEIYPDDHNIYSLRYGYFWYKYDYKNKGKISKIIELRGRSTGMASIISYIPENDIGIIIISNKLTDFPTMVRRLFLNRVISK